MWRKEKGILEASRTRTKICMIYKEITGEIIGCAMEVHRTLGPGFQEYFYQRALVDDTVTVEIKARNELEDVHWAQSINYLETSSYPIGLLINFGAKSLEVKRLINTRANSKQ